MNKEQKAEKVAQIAASIRESEAVFAVDYRGISVPQAAELRTKLIEAGAPLPGVKKKPTPRGGGDGGAGPPEEEPQGPAPAPLLGGGGGGGGGGEGLSP